jgi:hypothetical protein
MRRSWSSRAACALVVLALAFFAAAPRRAHADEDDEEEEARVTHRAFRFAEKGKNMTITVAFTDVFDARLLADLDSGVATTVVLRAYVYPETKDALPIAFTTATLRVVYDLWEEVYEVQIDDTRGRRRYVEASQAEALKRVTQLVQFPVAPLARLPIGERYFVGIVVEVNPISQELLAEVRRWLAQDADKQRVAGDSSFFGSFVSIFVNPKIPVADRTLKLRSQPFYRAKR